MFSLSSLVGNAPSRAGLEFTPIGKRGSPRHTNSRRSPPASPGRMRLNTEKINNANINSTFDETTENFDTMNSIDLGASTRNTRTHTNFGTKESRARPQSAILGSENSNSIQALQADNKELSSENYNLKIEVATLSKFLKQTPSDLRELAHENVELKQQLMKTANELENVQRKFRDQVPASPRDDVSAVNAMRASYKEAMEEKDYEIHQLQRKLSAAAPPQVPQELLDKVEFLQSENQSLLRQVENAGNVSGDLKDVQSENNDLKAELYKVKRQLSELPSNAAEQLEKYELEHSTAERRLRAAEEDLNQAEAERDSAQSAVKSLRLELDDKRSEIDRLASQVASLTSGSRTSKDRDSQLEAALEEVSSLRSRLKRMESSYEDLAAEKDAEHLRLQNKLKAVTNELKAKDKDEYSLRSQVRSLMEERATAFDNHSTVRHYQRQIDDLRAKEETLAAENRELQNEVAKLTDELYATSIDSSKIRKLTEESAELQERLDFYEKEHSLLQDTMASTEQELEVLDSKYKRSAEHIASLEAEVDTLTASLREKEQLLRKKSSDFEEESRKRSELESRRSTFEVDSLKSQIRKLEDELELARSRPTTTYGSDYSRQSPQLVKLQNELDSKDIDLQEKQRNIQKLQNSIHDKDAVIDALEARVRELNREIKTNFSVDDRSDFYKLKSDFDHQLRTLQVDNDRVRRDLEDELRYYKNRADALAERDSAQSSAFINSTSPIVALLESELEEARRTNKELLEKATKLRGSGLEQSSRLAEEYDSKIRDLEFRLKRAQDDKSRMEDSVDAMEQDAKLLRQEKSRLEVKVESLTQDLARTSQHCTKLATKINEMEIQGYKNTFKTTEESVKTRRQNLQLQTQIEQLNSRLAAADLNFDGKVPAVENRLLRNELNLCKAKLFELSTRCSDLANMNHYMAFSIQNSNHLFQRDLDRLAQAGITPDTSRDSISPRKVTFKAVATMVLAAVRLQKRAEKSRARTVKLRQLKADIESDRRTILS